MKNQNSITKKLSLRKMTITRLKPSESNLIKGGDFIKLKNPDDPRSILSDGSLTSIPTGTETSNDCPHY